jgi:hypothetical protein
MRCKGRHAQSHRRESSGIGLAGGFRSPDNDVVLAVRRLAAADLLAVTLIVGGLPDYGLTTEPC